MQRHKEQLGTDLNKYRICGHAVSVSADETLAGVSYNFKPPSASEGTIGGGPADPDGCTLI